MELGEQARVPTGILQEISEVLADKHLHERNFLLDVNGVQVPDIAYRYLGNLA
jgi:crotonobetainyl-CoA:carnitine CoA-transferase CaiB-like acyl-CoA transferase